MGEAKAAAAEASGVTSTAFKGMAGIGKAALFGIAGGAIAVGAVSIKMAGDFQESMTQLVTGAGESQKNIGMVSKGILAMAGEVGVSAQDLASGMYMVESAGFRGAAGLNVMKVAAEGAKVGGADMSTVADALTSALNAYHLPASAAAAVTNDLIATVASGKMHMQDLAGALGTVLPAASTAGISLKEVSAAIATMTMQGTPAADAATYLRQTILQLENPAPKAQKALASIGMTAQDVHESLAQRGLAGTLDLLTTKLGRQFPEDARRAAAEFAKVKAGTETSDQAMQHLSGTVSQKYIASLADMVGGTKSMQAALELTGGNMVTFQGNIAGIGTAVTKGGNSVQGWAETQKDFNVQVDQVKASLGAMAIQIGMVLIPYVQKAAAIGVQWANYLMKHKDVALMVAVAVGSILVVAIGAYTVSMIAAAAATVAATWPVLAIIAAIALLAAGVVYAYTHWGWFRVGVQAALKPLQEIFGFLKNDVPPIWQGFIRDVSAAWNGLKAFGSWITSTLGPIFDKIGQGAQKAGQLLNFLNPFAKHSPSLVENVQAGANLIAGHYAGLARSVGSSMATLPGYGGIGTSSLSGLAAAAGSAASFPTEMRVTLNRNYDLQRVRQLLEQILQNQQASMSKRASGSPVFSS